MEKKNEKLFLCVFKQKEKQQQMFYESSAVSCEAATLDRGNKEPFTPEFFVFTKEKKIVPLDDAKFAWDRKLSMCRTLLFETSVQKKRVLALHKKMNWPADLIQIQKMEVESGATCYAFVINFEAPFWKEKDIRPNLPREFVLEGSLQFLNENSLTYTTIAGLYEPEIKTSVIQNLMAKFSTSTTAEYADLEKKYGVTSPIAKYAILEANKYRTAPIAVDTAANKWAAEKKRVWDALEKHKLTNLDKKDPNETLLFAFAVMQTLKFNDETQTLQCPYTKDATNFVTMLVTTGVCQCQCFSMYMIAMAQEFGFAMLTPLRLPGHVVPVVITNEAPAIACSATPDSVGLEQVVIKPNVRACFAEIEAGRPDFNHRFGVEFATKAEKTSFLKRYEKNILSKFKVPVGYSSKEKEEGEGEEKEKEKEKAPNAFFTSAHWQWDFMADQLYAIQRRKEKQNLSRFLKEVSNLATCVSLDPLLLLNAGFKRHIPQFPPSKEHANQELPVKALVEIRQNLINFGATDNRGLPTCFVFQTIFDFASKPNAYGGDIPSLNAHLVPIARKEFGHRKMVELEQKLKQTEAAVNKFGIVSRTIQLIAALLHLQGARKEDVDSFLNSWQKCMYGAVPEWSLEKSHGDILLYCLDAFKKAKEKFEFLKNFNNNDGFQVLTLMSVAEELDFADLVAPSLDETEMVLFATDRRTVAQWYNMNARTVKDFSRSSLEHLPPASKNNVEAAEVHVSVEEGPWTYLNILVRKILESASDNFDLRNVMLMFLAKSLLFPTWLFVIGVGDEGTVTQYFEQELNQDAQAPYNKHPSWAQIGTLVETLKT